LDLIGLINRKQLEADAISASIASQQADLNARLAVIDKLHTLQTYSMFSTEDVSFLFEQNSK
jgi:hypothetical protein